MLFDALCVIDLINGCRWAHFQNDSGDD
jgi:hypothetical protein